MRLLVQASTLLVVARLLGPHRFGAFVGMAALAVMFGTLSTFGTHTVLLAEVSREPERRTAVLPFALSTTLICGSLLFALYILLTTEWLRVAEVSFGVLTALGLTEIILQPLLNLSSVEHQGRGRIATSQALITLPLTLRLIAAISVWLMQPTDPLSAYASGYVGGSLLALLIGMLSQRQAWPHLHDWRLPQLAELRHAAGYAVLNLTATGPSELDKTLAVKLLPLGVAGVYAAGARVIGALTLPVIAMMLSAMPRLFRESNSQEARNSHLLPRVFAATLGYSLLLTVSLWIAAPMFDSLFGPRFGSIGETIRWLTLAVPGLSLRIAAGSALMALGKPWMRVAFEMVGLALLALASVLLVPQRMVSGMPLALALSEWSMAVIGWLLINFLQSSNRTSTSAARGA